MNEKLFLFAGEQSGDHYGSELVMALKPALLEGCGGPKMRAAGLHSHFHMEDFEIMGFQDTILCFPKLLRQFQQVRNTILNGRYDAVILIDYPGFNLRLARALRKRGYRGKIIQYVSPSIWAWGSGRIQTMVENLDLLLTIFPFEADCFRNTTLPVTYVGHPIVASIRNHQYQNGWCEHFALDSNKEILAIFPGSRNNELKRGLKKQLTAAAKIRKKNPKIQIAISSARDEHSEMILSSLSSVNLQAVIVSGTYRYEMMQSCRCAMAASGTVTLELALHKTPTIVTYEVSSLNRFLIKNLIRPKVKYFSIVNILANREIFPEYIEKKSTPEILVNEIQKLLEESPLRQNIIEGCSQVIDFLGVQHTHERAAKAIQNLF